MSKPTPEHVQARRDLARVTAEIDVQMGGADHRVNLAECHLALRASHADLLSACKAALHHFTDIMDGNHGEHSDNPVPTQLRAAIRKAEQ